MTDWAIYILASIGAMLILVLLLAFLEAFLAVAFGWTITGRRGEDDKYERKDD